MANYLKNKLIILAAILSVILVLTTCDIVVIWPTIAITSEPSEISHTYAILNGKVIIDKFTKAGFEYGATSDYGISIYDISDSRVESKYTYVSCLLTSLSPNTTYHYRIKLESSAGIIYGNDVTFSTKDNRVVFNPDLNYGSVSDIDGNTYKTIKIGAQTWMAENLKATRLNNGTSIQLVVDDNQWLVSDSAVYCWVNNEEGGLKDTYGALYNWRAVNSYKLCPLGWHVPSNAEWTTLTTYLGDPNKLGDKIKETGDTHWLNPGASTTNESGFTALPAGYRNFNGSFRPGSSYSHWRGSEAYWWSSSNAYPGGAYYRVIYTNSNSLLMGSWRIEMGLSVRCVKD